MSVTFLEEHIETLNSRAVDWQEYARSTHAVLAGLGTGIDVDFRTRRLVGVGHSMGAAAVYVHLRVELQMSTVYAH